MTTEAQIGHGSLFQIRTGSPLAWVTLAEVTNITPPAIARDAQEATHMQSPNGFREFIAGLKDGGEVTLELNFVPGSSTTALILASMDKVGAAAVEDCRILFPDGSQGSPLTCSRWVFEGILTGMSPEAPVDDRMATTATVKITGRPVLTPAP